jgi:hypothetical protein
MRKECGTWRIYPPAAFVKKAIDAGEAKVFMATKDTFIRADMAGAILGLAAASRSPSPRAPGSRWSVLCCFRSVLYALLARLRPTDRRGGADAAGQAARGHCRQVLPNWVLVFFGNFATGIRNTPSRENIGKRQVLSAEKR